MSKFEEINKKKKEVRKLFLKAQKSDDDEDFQLFNSEWNKLNDLIEKYGWKGYVREVLIEKILDIKKIKI